MRPDCGCTLCRPHRGVWNVGDPLPECRVCQEPMSRARHEELGGVCTSCTPKDTLAFRAARERADAAHAEARRLARTRRETENRRRRGGRRA